MRARGLVGLGVIGLMVLSAVAIAGALTPAAPGTARTISFQKVMTAGNGFTMNVTGMLTVNSTARTVMGTITVTVTNSTGAVIAMVTKTISETADTSVEITESLALPMIGSTLMIRVDPVGGTASVSYVNDHHGSRN